MPSELKIGTRGSQLALFQANWVKDQLGKAYPDLNVTLIKIKTTGDKIQDVPLAKIGGKGLFVKKSRNPSYKKRSTSPSTASRMSQPSFLKVSIFLPSPRERTPGMSSSQGMGGH